MKLVDIWVDDWREAKRWWSMRWIVVSTFCSAAALAWPMMPEAWQSSLPTWIKGALAVGAMMSGGAAAVARVMKQKAPAGTAAKPPTTPANLPPKASP